MAEYSSEQAGDLNDVFGIESPPWEAKSADA
jgi:hypothetical protein